MSESKRRVAVIGGSESGKTELVAGLTRGHWAAQAVRALAFDPWLAENPRRWNPHGWATNEWEKFAHVVRRTSGFCVVWDEATMNGGRDRENVGLLTEIRHAHPYLYAIGHDYASFLPVMRGSLTDLVLARRPVQEAKDWANQFSDAEIMRAADLGQYEFLHKRAFQPVRVLRYSLAQLKAGVTL